MSPDHLDRRTVAILALALATITAGCGLFGGGGGPPSAETGEPGAASGADDGAVDDGDEPPEANQLPDAGSAGNGTGAPSSYTIESETRIRRGEELIRQNATVRIQQGEPRRSFVRLNRTLPGENRSKMVVESYTVGEEVYTQYRYAGGERAVYDRKSVESALNRSDPLTSLDAQFDFEQRDGGDGTVKFVADSTEQVLEPPANGSIENVSVVVTVDPDTGRQLAVSYHLRLAVDGQTYAYHVERRLKAMNNTSVSEPEWLGTAKTRTSR